MNISDVKIGDELYIEGLVYCDRGEDDMCGGIAIVEKIIEDRRGHPDNTYFVKFKNLLPAYNLKLLLPKQEDLKKRYGNRIAHHCPEGTSCPNPTKKKTFEEQISVTFNCGDRVRFDINGTPELSGTGTIYGLAYGGLIPAYIVKLDVPIEDQWAAVVPVTLLEKN